MKITRLFPTLLISGLAVTTCLNAAVEINFTLALDTATDSGATYNNYAKAGATTTTNYVIGFEIDITSVDGNAVDLAPVAAFCSEIAEPIGTGGHTFNLSSLSRLAAGTAQATGTASSNIPSGGIGALRAARLAYLFDEYYTSSVLFEWAKTAETPLGGPQTEVNPNIHAFQLAVWELTHDDDLNLTTGDMSLAAQTSNQTDIDPATGEVFVDETLTLRANARTLADQWITDVASQSISSSYESTKFTFYALTNIGSQDVILALDRSSLNEEEFVNNVPESSMSALLAGVLALGFVGTRRRLRSALV